MLNKNCVIQPKFQHLQQQSVTHRETSMDHNLSTAPTTIVNNSQGNNQLLLNAIKNKFAAQTASEAASFSPPKFNIPILKAPASFGTTEACDINESETETNGSPATRLNEFLLKQLQEQHKSNGLNKDQTGFVLPSLQLGNKLQNGPPAPVFELPVLKTTNAPISSLTLAVNKLQVNEKLKGSNEQNPYASTKTPVIDLSSALSSKLQSYQGTPPTRDFIKQPKLENKEDLDFEIPFIDCDRADVSSKRTIILPTSNEYCITDISQVHLQPCLVDPSPIGRLLNNYDNNYVAPLPLKCFSVEFQQKNVKHIIEPFRFDTKSPDDLVLESLNKYQRRYHN